MSTYSFEKAYLDYKYLKEKGYPDKAALKLVGDRYMLTRMGRNCLFRGVIVADAAEERRQKLVPPRELEGGSLGIDWYNVLITVESYLHGALLFIADDGIMRDSSAVHGSFRKSAATEKAMAEIVQSLRVLEPRRVDVFLDSPIAFSAVMAEEVRGNLAGVDGLAYEVSLAHTADFPLKSYPGIVASSDSIILDAALKVFDLARFILEQRFAFTPHHLLDLGRDALEELGRSSESGNPSP